MYLFYWILWGPIYSLFPRLVTQSRVFLKFSQSQIEILIFFSEIHDQLPPNIQPCVPSPCGPNSECREISNTAVCTCQQNYIGVAPNCRPECTVNTDCPSNLACIRNKCSDPCPGSCGFEAICNVYNHVPVCTCPEGYTGDPFSSCQPKPIRKKTFNIQLSNKQNQQNILSIQCYFRIGSGPNKPM